MSGAPTNGAAAPNGTGLGVEAEVVERIKQALQIVHNPHSSSETRKQAEAFLDNAKASGDAPYHGFLLASDKTQEPIVRHYALSLLEHKIKFGWAEYSEEQRGMIRQWTLLLAEKIDGSELPYVRNKIGQLWVDVAKREWGSNWTDMDEMLVNLWSKGNTAQKFLCLYILETLAGDVFAREDPIAGIRSSILTRACITIFCPASTPQDALAADDHEIVTRFGDDGWLSRIAVFLGECLAAGPQDTTAVNCALKSLSALKASVNWATPQAIAVARVVDMVGQALMIEHMGIRLTATECLQLVFGRFYKEEEDFRRVFAPMLHPDTVAVLIRIFEFTRIDPNEIDYEAYTFLQKFSEMAAGLQSAIDERIKALPPTSDFMGYLKLLYLIANHDSPMVSGPAISTWTKIFRSGTFSSLEAFSQSLPALMPQLLNLASSRLIRMEFVKDEDTPAALFLNNDFDTVPEKHAFLGNYRRFSGTLIESIVKRAPFEAFPYILSQVDASLNSVLEKQQSVNVNTYEKNSLAFLEVDAHFTAAEAAVKGFMKRVDAYSKLEQTVRTKGGRASTNRSLIEFKEQIAAFEDKVEAWVLRTLTLQFEDPLINRRIIQITSSLATTILDQRPATMLKTLEHILTIQPKDGPPDTQYSEAVKDLQSACYPEMQRMAVLMPEHLMKVYDQIKQKIDEIFARGVDDRQIVAYHTFLFTINHRAETIDPNVQMERLQSYIQPLKAAWTAPALTEALSSFDSFCNLLSLDKARQYLISHRVHEVPDFSNCPLDAEGQALQAELNEKIKMLPIRPTKAFLGVSTDKLKPGSRHYEVACNLWREAFVEILPNLLKFVSHAHAFHNAANWGNLPPEFQPVIKKVLTDRFWQSGISSGSRDQFYEHVQKTRTALEGLASTIRGTIRMVRESCYSILWCMSRMGMLFYGIDQLSQPLSHALFADAPCLSSHQMSILLNMTRFLIEDCPVDRRDAFLTPFLSLLFTQIDRKVTTEWALVSQKNQAAMNDDQLAEEMKEESILRQLTYIAVLTVSSILENPQAQADAVDDDPEPLMRDFILSNDTVLEPIILFCIHALRMHDSRCCGMIIRVFRSIIPVFIKGREAIREIICREVMFASIESLHDDYFVDVQKDLAQLIASVCINYAPVSKTPRDILTSLPNIDPAKVDYCIKRLLTGQNISSRVQRSLILDLLERLRGVALSEKGKFTQQTIVNQPQAKLRRPIEQPTSPDLGGIADMFS